MNAFMSMFSLYMLLPLGSIIRKHSTDFYVYADDIQFYFTLDNLHPIII